MKKTNFILTSILISFVLTGVLSFIPINTRPAIALMIELGLEDLAKEADFILRGEVTEMKSEWNADKTVIYTYITLKVKERIYGQYEADTITIKQRGGKVDGIGMAVSDSAVFMKGEDVIVFLKPQGTPQAARLQQVARGVITEVVGKMQGKYTVTKEGVAEGKTVIVNKGVFATKEGELVTRAGKKMPLEGFIGEIKRIKAGQR